MTPADDDHFYAAPKSDDPTARARAEVEPVDPDEVHEIRYHLEPRDSEAFSRAHFVRAKAATSKTPVTLPRMKRLWWRYLVGFGMVAFGLFLIGSLGFPGAETRPGSKWPGGLVLAFGGFTFLILFLQAWTRFEWRRAGRQLANLPEQRLRITRQGIDGDGGDGSRSWRPWELVPEVVVTNEILLLYLNDRKALRPIALTIPRRAFSTEEAYLGFGKAARYWSATAVRDSPSPAEPGPSKPVPEDGWLLRYQLTDPERSAQARANRWLASGALRGAIITTLLTLGCAVLMGETAPSVWNGGDDSVPALILAILGLLGTLHFGRFAWKTWRLSLFGARPDPSSALPVVLTATAEELTRHEQGGQEVGIPWSRMFEVRKDDRFLRLIQRSHDPKNPAREVLCIPHRAFASATERDRFLVTVGLWIAEAAPATGTVAGSTP